MKHPLCVRPRGRSLFPCPRGLGIGLLVVLLAFASGATAAPYIWDDDDDGVDDRLESVHALGYHVSFENEDTTARQRIAVSRLGPDLLYGVYVVYLETPDDNDVGALTLIGMPVLTRLEAVPALRSAATYFQIQMCASLPNVERIEAVPILYPEMRDAAATAAASDPSGTVFPSWSGVGGASGEGVSVAILDTGVNDTSEGSYPGHESLLGKYLGGALVESADSSTHTPKSGSVNPTDHGGEATRSHGTHVAGIVLGTGGPSGYARGVAPAARFVDVKVLNDAGLGTAVPEALDWCIANRDRDWGVPGYEGIDLICMALSSFDESDGNDVGSRLAARAAELGIVVVASMGNEGQGAYCPSPAGGDGVLSVAAWDALRSAVPEDDAYPSFNNYGPRAGDGDADLEDEQKPDLLAPGVAVLSADGSLTSDGAQYQRLSGTSMAAAMVSGAAACLLSQDPSLEPPAVAELLRATARRNLTGAPVGSAGADPRWTSTIGFGLLEMHGAWLELTQPLKSQIRRFALAATDSTITATLWTQREMGAQHFVFERALDLGGSPGEFAAVDSVAAAGDPSLDDAANLQEYVRLWVVPPSERGQLFWYRVAYTEGGARHTSPERAHRAPIGAAAATVELTIVHNAYDTDVDGAVEVGGAGGSGIGESATPALVLPLEGSSTAVSHDWVTGASVTGNVAWTFRLAVPAGPAEAYLPASAQNPWLLRLEEGGYVNRSGRVTEFRVVWHGPDGDVVTEGGPLPQPTLEGQTAYVSAPYATTGVDIVESGDGIFGPNPVRAGSTVHFRLPRGAASEIVIQDVRGRRLARVPLRPEGEESRGAWRAAREDGGPLGSGIYFARATGGPTLRLVVIHP